MKRRLSVGAAVAAVLVSETLSAVTPMGFYGKGMVLQRDVPLKFQGRGKPGETVVVRLGDDYRVEGVTGSNGWWCVTGPALKACKTGRTLTFRTSDKVPAHQVWTFEDVLVGDVWFCAGQSNMAWPWTNVGRCCTEENLADAIALAKELPFVRYADPGAAMKDAVVVDCSRLTWNKPATDAAGWKANTWSAVPWFFAARLAKELDVPQGIVVSAIGGSFIEPWVAPEGYRMTKGCEKYVTALDARDPSTPAGKAAFAAMQKAIDDWQAKTAELAAKGVRPTEPLPHLPDFCDLRNLTMYWNGTISCLTKLPIRGVIWYQGCSNAKDPDYCEQLQALVAGWRKAWGFEFPFYYVQLAGYGKPQKDDCPEGGTGFASVRDQQRKALKLIPNSAMATAIDVGEAGNIHPHNKRDTGDRLARLALARDFGRKDVIPSGPLFRSLKREGGKLRVTFDYAAGGLVVAKKDNLSFKPAEPQPGAKLGGFAIAGRDGVWQWADAQIDGETVVLSSEKVLEPVSARYAYDANPMGRANLYGKESLLPAVPFAETAD